MLKASKQPLFVCLAIILIAGCRTVKTKSKEQVTISPSAPDSLSLTTPRHKDSTIQWKESEYNMQVTKPPVKTIYDHYEAAYNELETMLQGKKPLNFKRAVFVTENAWYRDSLSYSDFSNQIQTLSTICNGIGANLKLNNYEYPDSIRLKKNYAIYSLMKDTVNISNFIDIMPYAYNFSDFSGTKDWTTTFVTTLLSSGSGTCHSLPYLYKILANELQAEAWLSLAPNHIYLKHRNKRLGWYNTELTSGEFPTDAWIKASGYITLDAIRNGIYMDTLSQAQSIALCAFDLAKGYAAKTGNYYDGFILKCCDLALKYHDKNINALILKAETLKKLYDRCRELNDTPGMQRYHEQMQPLYLRGLQLGYREMPPEMYRAWLESAKEGKEKFSNPEIKSTFNTKTSKP